MTLFLSLSLPSLSLPFPFPLRRDGGTVQDKPALNLCKLDIGNNGGPWQEVGEGWASRRIARWGIHEFLDMTPGGEDEKQVRVTGKARGQLLGA